MVKNELMSVSENNAVIPGLEDSTMEDLTLPRLKASGKRGLFENKITGSAVPKLECVLLTRLKTRTKFNEDGYPECRSNDRATGSTYGKCAECEFATAKDDKGKTLCPPAYDFLLMMEGHSIPYVLSISAVSALGPAKTYITSFLVEQKPLYSFKTILSFVEKKSENKTTGEKFSYYGLEFKRGADIDIKDQKIYNGIMGKFRIRADAPDIPDVEPDVDLESSGCLF